MLTDDELLALMTEEVIAHEAPIEMVLRPLSALHLAGLLQLALRHPGTREHEDAYYVAVTFLEHVRAYFADAPATLEVLRRGDDPAYDGGRRQPPPDFPNSRIGAVTLARLRAEVSAGAGHDCEEWWSMGGRCVLCDRRR